MATVLLAGGAGYIGSNTAVELQNAGYDVVVADNYSNSSLEAIRRVEKITGKTVKLYEADVRDTAKILGWTTQYTPDDMRRDSWNWQKNNPNGYRD